MICQHTHLNGIDAIDRIQVQVVGIAECSARPISRVHPVIVKDLHEIVQDLIPSQIILGRPEFSEIPAHIVLLTPDVV